MNRAAALNQEAPWIYSNEWYDKFVEEMNLPVGLYTKNQPQYIGREIEMDYLLDGWNDNRIGLKIREPFLNGKASDMDIFWDRDGLNISNMSFYCGLRGVEEWAKENRGNIERAIVNFLKGLQNISVPILRVSFKPYETDTFRMSQLHGNPGYIIHGVGGLNDKKVKPYMDFVLSQGYGPEQYSFTEGVTKQYIRRMAKNNGKR